MLISLYRSDPIDCEGILPVLILLTLPLFPLNPIHRERHMAPRLPWLGWYFVFSLLLLWTNKEERGGILVEAAAGDHKNVATTVTCTQRSKFAYYFVKANVYEISDSRQLEKLLSHLPEGQPTIIKLAGG